MSATNPFGDHVRIVDRRRIDYSNIDRHIEMQPGDGLTKTLARLPLPDLKAMADASIAKGDFAGAAAARAAAELRRTGVPPELTGPGQLHSVTAFDPREGRAVTSYHGDPKVWRDDFSAPAVPFEITPPQALETREGVVRYQGNETLIARSADGRERIVHLAPIEARHPV
jgi:hypothetical protein